MTGLLPTVPDAGATLAQFKNFFFDSAPVLAATDAATRKALSGMGAVVMRAARQSIKTRPGSSPPGTPPHAHDFFFGTPGKSGRRPKRYRFKTSILFGYDPARGTLVVGPHLFAGAKRNPTAPQANEFGVGGYDRRPFMRPAMERVAPRFPNFFRNTV